MQVDHPVDLFFCLFSPGHPPRYQIFRKEPDTKKALRDAGREVEIKRFELLTPCLQSRCSTN